tara:strand:- start:94 stop:468 length:375 start_codon:yes stop_codon:yes gene_type:complete
MANPSDTGGSGVGTEVLRRAYLPTITNAANQYIINGVANHIYTILTITVVQMSNATDTINMVIEIDGSSPEIYLIREMSLGPYETFVWSDKIVLTDTDELIIATSSGSSDVDVYCAFIDQEFTT